MMIERRVRHAPVVADGGLRGIVSIGDVVKSRIDELETERAALTDYIADRLHHRQPLARRIQRRATDAPQSAADIAASLTCPVRQMHGHAANRNHPRRLPAAPRPSKAQLR